MIPVLNFCILLFQDKSINENYNLLKKTLPEHGGVFRTEAESNNPCEFGNFRNTFKFLADDYRLELLHTFVSRQKYKYKS
jgi:hypothetical protein